MGILALSGKLTLRGMRRILFFVCLTALLCIAAGLLGNFFLHRKQSVVEPMRVAVVDEDDTLESRMLTRYLTELEGYEALLAFTRTDRAQADSLMEEGAVDAVLILPREFVVSVLDGRNQPFLVMLRGDSELRAAFVRVFSDLYAGMLHAGQTGVYASLSAARDAGEEAYQQMFRDANLRFFTAMISGRAMIREQELTATGQVGAVAQYAASTLVFVMLLGGVLLLDLWSNAAARPVLLRLRAMGHAPLKTGTSYLAGATLPFLLSGAALAAGAGLLLRGQLRPSTGMLLLIPALILIAFCAAALMMAVAGLVGGGASGCILLFAGNLLCLFLSGGILPSAYLSPFLRALGSLMPHYWLTRLLLDAMAGTGELAVWIICIAFAALFAAFALLGILRRGRVGAKP